MGKLSWGATSHRHWERKWQTMVGKEFVKGLTAMMGYLLMVKSMLSTLRQLIKDDVSRVLVSPYPEQTFSLGKGS